MGTRLCKLQLATTAFMTLKYAYQTEGYVPQYEIFEGLYRYIPSTDIHTSIPASLTLELLMTTVVIEIWPHVISWCNPF